MTEREPEAAPRCAMDTCASPPCWVVLLDEREPLAYACHPTHFRDVMYATRHLGARRLIARMSESAKPSQAGPTAPTPGSAGR